MGAAIAGAVVAALLLLYPARASAAAAAGEGRRLHTLFSVECGDYFDWQAVGLLHSLRKARQPGGVTRLVSCVEDQLPSYRGLRIGHTLQVPSFSRHPRTGDWYPAINKTAGIVHWLKHSPEADNVYWVVILDADQIIRGPIIPWELGAEKGKPFAAYYGHLKGCDNILAQLHTAHPEFCDKVGGILALHIDDLRALAPLWLSKTEEVRQDKSHWSTNITGDIYGMGWISEMYGYSFGAAKPGNITRLLSCTDEDLKNYKGHDLAPTHYVPSMSHHPLTGDWYPAINKPAAVLHWLNHVQTDAEFLVILYADMIMRGPITQWEYGAKRGHPVSTPYEYLIGCDNILAKIHTRNPSACDKVGSVIIMHIDDLRRFALLWLHKSEEVRADKAHYATNITGDIYNSGWISEMYGYSFAAAEIILRHVIRRDIMIYPGYVPLPGAKYRVFHYGLRFGVGNWSFDKADWRNADVVNTCWAKFPEPPDPATIMKQDLDARERDLLSIECGRALNKALYLHHKHRNCPQLGTFRSTSRKADQVSASNKIERVPQKSSTKSMADGREKTVERTAATVQPLHRSRRLARSSTMWIIAMWVLSIVVFLLVISVFFTEQRRNV
ncbi:peptidyl serine alpha-galactosyltransferase isoform X2 [Miscanthus floridulus]|uniref:peptidyl serine alpha-galactosyltransferase isoform X2 n=1 Tax=Miscanthus floridulus TaxID=154761 RepID=UPI003458EFD7